MVGGLLPDGAFGDHGADPRVRPGRREGLLTAHGLTQQPDLPGVDPGLPGQERHGRGDVRVTDGRLDNLLARRLSRGTWLAGRLGFSAVLVLAAGLPAGAGGWAGLAARHGGTGFAAMMQAGLNIAVPALFILGLGTLLYGLAPRLAAPALYAVILWSFLIEIIGSSITGNHWLLDTAVLSHLGPVPATSLNWTAIGWLTGLALAAALAGSAAFRRRDLAAA